MTRKVEELTEDAFRRCYSLCLMGVRTRTYADTCRLFSNLESLFLGLVDGAATLNVRRVVAQGRLHAAHAHRLGVEAEAAFNARASLGFSDVIEKGNAILPHCRHLALRGDAQAAASLLSPFISELEQEFAASASEEVGRMLPAARNSLQRIVSGTMS